jgi:hypothetical protein
VRKLQYIAELERKVQALQVRSFIKYVNYSSKSSFSFYILLLMSIYATKKNIYSTGRRNGGVSGDGVPEPTKHNVGFGE